MNEENRDYKQTINAYRAKIDAIDEKIVKLINQRASLGYNIGKLKVQLNLPVLAVEREEQVLNHVRTCNGGPMSDQSLEKIYLRIMEETRSLESSLLTNNLPE